MSDKTNIAWTDSTINFWSGCTKVSPGCAHCYAETRDKRHMIEDKDHWGKGAPRLKHVGAVKQVLAMNRKPWICDQCGESTVSDINLCERCGLTGSGRYHRRRIFSLSLGDIMDEEVEIEMLYEALFTIWKCRECVWILCSKRWQNFVERMAVVLDVAQDKDGAAYPETEANAFWWWLEHWITGEQPPKNIILLTSVENQAMADKRIPELLKIPAACRGLSLEPLLGPVNLKNWIWEGVCGCTENEPESGDGYKCKHCRDTQAVTELDWLIIGGESGHNARPCNVDWIRSLVEQGSAAGVATFVKQLGADPRWNGENKSGEPCKKITDKKGGDPSEWPKDLQIQKWPKGF